MRHKEMSEKARVMMEKLKQSNAEANKDEDYVSLDSIEVIVVTTINVVFTRSITERATAKTP